jgi:hypothetical protein
MLRLTHRLVSLSRSRYVLSVIACFVFIVVATSVRAHFKSSRASAQSVRQYAPGHEMSGTSPENKKVPLGIESEIITIRRGGFEPAEIIRPKGPVLWMVDNRSGLKDVSLHLDQEHGNRLRDMLVHREQLDWSETIDLPPGRYQLTEADHPDWICHITITAK